MPERKFLPITDEEVKALLVAVTNECSELLPEGDDRLELAQEAVGRALEFASKWSSDIDSAIRANGGNAGLLVASEILAYGALTAIFKSHPPQDLRRQLFAAGNHVGAFMLERWRANQRQETFRAAQGDPD